MALPRFLSRRRRTESVMGHSLPEPRLTAGAWKLIMLYVGVPVFMAGMVVDGLIQLITGQCTGVWCWLV